MSALHLAAENISARIRTLSERPQSITVREVIDRFMLVYAKRDTSIGQRLDTWSRGTVVFSRVRRPIYDACF